MSQIKNDRLGRDLAERMLEASPDCVKLLSADGVLTFINRRGLELIQVETPVEVVGRVYAELWPDDERAKITAAIAESAEGRESHVEGFCPTAKGEARWWETRFAPVKPEEGEPAVIIAISRDISERRTAELSARTGALDPRGALQASRFGAWSLDLATGVMATSETCRTNFGRDPKQDFTYADLRAMVHPDDRDRMAATVERSIATGVDYDIEYRIVTRPGVTRWINISGRPSYDAEGSAVRMAGVSLDVTERRRGESLRLALVELGDRVRDLDDLAEISYAAAELLGRTLGLSRAGYGVVDMAAETITIARDWNAPGIRTLAGVLRFRDYGSYIDDLKRGDTVVFEDSDTDPRTMATSEALKAISAQAAINMPLNEQGGLVALIYLNHATARAWPPEEIAFLREVAERTHAVIVRRRAEQELRALADSLERQVEARTRERDRTWTLSQDLLGVANFDGFFEHVNPAWEAVLGWTAQQVRDTPFMEFVHPDDRDRTAAEIGRLAAGVRTLHFLNRYRTKDGGYRWLSWTAVPDDGTIYTAARDITAAKAAEEALEASEARLRAVFATNFQYQALLDPDGALLDANATSLAGVGLTLGDVAGRKFWDTPWFTATPGLPEVVRAAVAAAAAGETVRQEMLLNLPAGARSLDFAIRPIRDEDGAISALVPEAMDITERRQAEEALRQSQKLEAIGQLTGGVAHDFNNLLTPIMGSLDLLRRRGLGGEREQRMIEGALQSAERAKTLVQRLLAFARRQPLQMKPVDVTELLAGMVDLIASTSGPQIRVRLDVADDLPLARADANQLEMAILNLAVNARDAMPEGGALTISAEGVVVGRGHPTKLRPKSYVRLSVADTGTGMDAATLARAIEPFFSTKGIGKGTGLGLSMVHGLATQLGGALTIASKPNLGSSVELWLPVASGLVEASSPAASASSNEGAVGAALLVDDEDLIRMSTADMLADMGYEVIEARSAEEALGLHQSGARFDLLVTDHLMPGMTGTDLARALRAVRPDLPVLIVSGFASAAEVAPDLPRLSKPFVQAELAETLARIAPRQRAND